MNKTHMKKTRVLAECAILIALSTVLSFIKVWQMPWGGSITLFSMLPVCYISIRHGIKWGLGSAFVYSCIQLFCSGALNWGLTAGMLVACMIFDYIVPFTVLGFSGMFSSKGVAGAVAGTSISIVLRFVSHFVSGVYVWVSAGKLWSGFETSKPWLYSLVYNGAYMLPELIMTVIGAVLVYKALEKHKV